MFVKTGAPPPGKDARGGTPANPTNPGGRITPGGTTASRGTSGGGTPPGGTSPGGASGRGTTGTGEPGGAPPTPPKTVEDNSELIAPPKPPPPPSMNEVARKEIEELLEQYRRAYEGRNFDALQRTWPSAPAALRNQFKQYNSLKYSFAGPPKYVQLDAFGGTAVIELGTNQTGETSLGKRSLDWVETLDVQKRGADNQWIIASVTRAQK